MRTLTQTEVGALIDRAWAEIAQGRERQKAGAYERAADLATEAMRHCETARLPLAPAQNCLAHAYWRRGRHDEARVVALVGLSDPSNQGVREQVMLLNALCLFDQFAGSPEEVIRRSARLSPLVEAVDDHKRRGQFHHNYANALHRLKLTDRAFIEYEAAGHYFGEAGCGRDVAAVKNNVGDLFVVAGRPADAHDYLDDAERIFRTLSDESGLGQVYETRACAYEAERRFEEALAAINRSLSYLEGGDEAGLIKQSEITRGRILSKLRLEGVWPLVLEMLSGPRCDLEGQELLAEVKG